MGIKGEILPQFALKGLKMARKPGGLYYMEIQENEFQPFA
jgi:hypothetical protein